MTSEHQPTDFGAGYWEDRYRGGEGVGRHDPSPSLVTEVAGLPPGSALDAGCGSGADARWLAAAGWQVVAVDISATAVARAQEAAAEPIAWVQADLTAWDPGRSFDLVTSHFVHVPGPPADLYRRLASWVAPGGTLLVVGHASHGQHEHPEGATAEVEQVTACLPEQEWEVLVAEPRTHEVRRPDGSSAQRNDVVVRARRVIRP